MARPPAGSAEGTELSPINGRCVLLIVVIALGSADVHAQDEAKPKPVKPGAASAIIKVAPSVAPPAEAHRVGVKPPEKVVEITRAPLAATVLRKNNVGQNINLAVQPFILRAGEVLVTKSAAAAVRQPGTTAVNPNAVRWVLPYEFRFVSHEATVRTAHLAVEVAGGGLRMAQTAGEFTGQIFVALEDQQDRTLTYSLPVPAQVLVTAPVDKVDPANFAIDTTDKWTSVGLSAINPPAEFKAKVRASTDPDGVEIDLRVVRPTLTVAITPDHIQGLGLELAAVNIVAPGLPNPKGRTITLTSTKGSLTNTQVQLSDQGTAQTRIRSIAIGSTRIEATSPPLAEGISHEITFVWPWPFALAAILGGAIGAFVRRRQAKRNEGRGQGLLGDVLTGGLAGLVVAVLYAIGVNLLPVTPTATAGEALVFGLAALGGFLGLRMPRGS